MKTISSEKIDEEWEKINSASEEEIQALSHQMQKEQPYIMVYLLAADENIYDEEDRGRLMELGAVVWRIMSSAGKRLRQVTAEQLDDAEEANLKFLEKLDENSEMEMTGSITQFFADYNQMPMLGAVLEALMAGNEESPEYAPDSVGLAMLHLKTVIDCLDQ